MFASGSARPGATVIERVLGPCEVVVNGKPTLMFGSNNYLGLTLEPAVVAAARDAVLRIRHRHHRIADGERHAVAARGSRARVRRLVPQAARPDLQHRLSGEPVGHRRPLRRRRHHPDRQRQPREHLRRHAPDRRRRSSRFRHNSPESLRKKLERLPAGAAQPPGRRRGAVFDSRRRGAAARDRRGVPRARRVPARRRSAFARHLRSHRSGLRRGSGRPGPGRLHRRHVLEVAGGRRRRVRLGSSPSCARCISWRGPTCSRRRARRRTWRACGRRSASSASIPSFAIGCGPTSGGCARACARLGYAHRLDRVADRADFHRRGGAHDRAVAGTAASRALREPDRAARLPAGRVRAARQLLGRAHAGTNHARARHLRAGPRRRRRQLTA